MLSGDEQYIERTGVIPGPLNGDLRREGAGGEADSDLASEEMLVNMGPQHPSTHGVLRLILRTDGEMVMNVVADIGYLHRCAEKIGESVSYTQYTPYTDRLDYLAAMNNNVGYALAVEKLAGIEAPPRAQYLRVIMAELNRIASHLVTLGTYGLDMGAFTPFLYAFRERELILDLFEAVCGARLTYSYVTIGGVRYDLPGGWVEKCGEFLEYFEPKLAEYNDLLSFNQIFIKRTANVGVISADRAIAYGLTGPVLRGSGVRWDLRKVIADLAYSKIDFEVCVGDGRMGQVGDSWDRYFVRVLEMYQSVRIIRQALAQLPEGEVKAKVGRVFKPPVGEVYYEIENPRGQLGFYIVSDGSATPYRLKVRGPSFCNLSIIGEATRDCLLGDIPAILGSIDVVMGEVDR